MKSIWKRMLLLLLIFIVLLALWAGAGSALNRSEILLTGEMTNPLYPCLPEPEPEAQTAGAYSLLGDGSYVTVSEASELLRDAMVARDTGFTINIYAPDAVPNIKQELFPGAYAQDNAVGYADGDYLRWSWKTINWTGTELGDGKYSFTFSVTYYTTAAQEQAVTASVEQALKTLGTENMTDYQKVAAIYDYICTAADYDYDALSRVTSGTATSSDYLIFTAYGAILQGKAVCQGYACLFYTMCRQANVPVRIIHNSTHAWNIAGLGDLWYNLDATWDGEDATNRREYFLKGTGNFHGHTAATEFYADSFLSTYPLSETDYALSGQDSCYPHSFGEWVLTVPACEQTGLRTYTCETCQFTKTETVAITGHRHVKTTKEATCTEPGGVYYVCRYCGDSYEEESTPALGHSYQDTVVAPSCTEVGYTSHSCIRCGHTYVDSELPALGHSWDTGTETQAATEQQTGEITYTCTLCQATKLEETPPLNHSYDAGVITREPSCEASGEKTYTCTDCGQYYTVELPALGHCWDSGTITTAPTEEAEGVRTYSCTQCGTTRTESVDVICHHFDDGTVIEAATCGKSGLIRYTCTDEGCGYSYTETLLPDSTAHRYTTERTEPTCTEHGTITGVCVYCGDQYEMEEIPALGHDYKATRTEPACTEPGEEILVCNRCSDTSYTVLPAKGHRYVPTVIAPTCQTEGYTLHICRDCGDRYRDSVQEKLSHEYQAVTVPATCTREGYTRFTCIYCQGTYQTDPTPALGHSYDSGQLTQYPTSTRTGQMVYTCETCGEQKTETLPRLTCPFIDVPSHRFYYEPVLWAANFGIAKGMTDSTYEPDLECTRGQVITFLWRAAGKPEPETRTHSFADVNPAAFYYEAMLWGVEQGIVQGITDTTFGPTEPCTREQVVTFLWRAAGKPEPQITSHSFTDVNPSAYYYNAMLWAVEQNITNGDGTTRTFRPKGICTRGQVITFLYRHYVL